LESLAPGGHQFRDGLAGDHPLGLFGVYETAEESRSHSEAMERR